MRTFTRNTMPETPVHDLLGIIPDLQFITIALCDKHGLVWDHQEKDDQNIDACWRDGCRIEASWFPNDLDCVDMRMVYLISGNLYTNR